MIEAIRAALALELERDPAVVLLGLDVGTLGGVFRTTRGLQAQFGPDRVIDTPLSEAAIVGTSIGLGLSGLKPVAELQFLGFAHQAFHQLGPQLARFRFRSQGRFQPQVTIRAPFGGGTRTPEFHADAIEAQLTHMPGLKVVLPATPFDAKGLLLEAIRDPDPVLFLEPERLYRKYRQEVPDDDYTVPLGKLRIAREGTQVTLVAWSAAVELAELAAAKLAEEGISAAVIDLRTLVPLDVEGLVAAVKATGRCVVIHEAVTTAGFGAEIAATIQEEAFFALDAPIARVAAPDTPYPPATLEPWFLPTVERIIQTARQTARL